MMFVTRESFNKDVQRMRWKIGDVLHINTTDCEGREGYASLAGRIIGFGYLSKDIRSVVP